MTYESIKNMVLVDTPFGLSCEGCKSDQKGFSIGLKTKRKVKGCGDIMCHGSMVLCFRCYINYRWN